MDGSQKVVKAREPWRSYCSATRWMARQWCNRADDKNQEKQRPITVEPRSKDPSAAVLAFAGASFCHFPLARAGIKRLSRMCFFGRYIACTSGQVPSGRRRCSGDGALTSLLARNSNFYTTLFYCTSPSAEKMITGEQGEQVGGEVKVFEYCWPSKPRQ